VWPIRRRTGAFAVTVVRGAHVDAAVLAQADGAALDRRAARHLRHDLEAAAAEVGAHAELLVDDRPCGPVRAQACRTMARSVNLRSIERP
jgi:hypothetical protein